MYMLDMQPILFNKLKKCINGTAIHMNDEAYEGARRVWNGLIDAYPAVIVQPATDADVVKAVEFARSLDLSLSIRGGGHNIAGTALNNGGIVVDMARMKRVRIDPVQRIARVEAGLTLGEFVWSTQQYGLGTTVGVNSTTGLAGLTLGGGIGWLQGRYGLTVDSLLGVTIVTADGQVLRANRDENAELFWGVRGGGGNFGIVTSFEFQLYPIGTLLGGKISYPSAMAGDVLRFYRDFSSSAPDELTVYASFITKPDGTPAVGLSMCYCGPLEQGECLLAPLKRLGQPLLNTIGPKTYLEQTAMMDKGSPHGRRYYGKHVALSALSDDAIDTIVEYGRSRTSRYAQVLIQHVHGFPTRVAADATAAYALRREQYLIGGIAAWNAGEAGRHLDWSHACWNALRPHALDAVYVNFLDRDDADRIPGVYGPSFERLVALKRHYDPTNFFHINQNIVP